MNFHLQLPPLTLLSAPMYWTTFWSLLYAACPPREWFNSPRYDLFLKLVNFYGGLNIRSVFMKVFYKAPPEAAAPVPTKVVTNGVQKRSEDGGGGSTQDSGGHGGGT
jgi:hypothetical protein